MSSDWSLRLTELVAASAPEPMAGAMVALIAYVAFVVLIAVGSIFARSWPSEAAFLVAVAGGLLVDWVSMIALTLASVVTAALIGAVVQRIAPKRNARLEAEAMQQYGPKLDALSREIEMDQADKRSMVERARSYLRKT